MNTEWRESETSTHQDHVVAHVIGASALGYFVHDETLHLVLDMGFVWTIYLDGQMGLLPTGVSLSELEMEPEAKSVIVNEVESLMTDAPTDLTLLSAMRIQISSVRIYEHGDERMIEISDEDGVMRIVTSFTTRGFEIQNPTLLSG